MNAFEDRPRPATGSLPSRSTLGVAPEPRASLPVSAIELGITRAIVDARGLAECEEASDLELVGLGPHGKRHFLVPTAARAWRSLHQAAAAEGVDLVIVSAFRSVARQAEIVRGKLAAGQTMDDILAVCAPPGFSEHHSGRAVDLSTPGSTPLEPEFDQTEAFAWLQRQAGAFGFRLSYPAGNALGYCYEPWHWCFDATHPGPDWFRFPTVPR